MFLERRVDGYHQTGARLTRDVEKKRDVALMTLRGELVALATAAMDSKAIMDGEKGECARPQRVFIHPNEYPKSWHS